MAYSEYGNPADMLSPAMGQIMMDDPDKAAEYLASLGVHPRQFQQLAQTATGTATDAPNTLVPASPETFIPPSGSLGGPSPYEQPPSAPGMKPGQTDPHLSMSDVLGRAKDFYGPLVGKGLQNMIDYGRGPLSPVRTAPLATEGKKRMNDRVEPDEPGKVPPKALGKTAEDNNVADEPYTPSTRYATVAGSEDVPLPRSRPGPEKEADTEEVSAARKKREAIASAFTGVKAPPAPPVPRLSPEPGRAGHFPDKSPIIALLAGVLSGQPPGPELLRLSQALSGK